VIEAVRRALARRKRSSLLEFNIAGIGTGRARVIQFSVSLQPMPTRHAQLLNSEDEP